MNPPPTIVLIHPPVVKPCEPPAGIARLTGALQSQGIGCIPIDANLEGLYYLLSQVPPPTDTWSHRAYLNRDRHLESLRSAATYRNADHYRRAVADINRLLSLAGNSSEIRLGLADYRDTKLSPLRSADLLKSAQTPARNPYFNYFQDQLLPQIIQHTPQWVGISINFLSQALCAFTLIGLLKKSYPHLKIVIGGGLISSWLQINGRDRHFKKLFKNLVDQIVSGPGEPALLHALGRPPSSRYYLPDYTKLLNAPYLSPGPILPFSASEGCWWRRCAFCPERAEKRPFRPIPIKTTLQQMEQMPPHAPPALIHFLDNAISPALLKRLATTALKSPWYGFVRIAPPLDDIDFCYQLAACGCVMLKIGLESGSQQVLNRLEKGVSLDMASRVLHNLKQVGISTYVYLLFGTPAENEITARKTLAFTADHCRVIDFLNLAIFNLPLNSPDAADLQLKDFYEGDLALYRDFKHPSGWDRWEVRNFLSKSFRKHPAIQPILRRDPPIFTSNHAPFFR